MLRTGVHSQRQDTSQDAGLFNTPTLVEVSTRQDPDCVGRDCHLENVQCGQSIAARQTGSAAGEIDCSGVARCYQGLGISFIDLQRVPRRPADANRRCSLKPLASAAQIGIQDAKVGIDSQSWRRLRIDGLRADGHRHVVIEQPLRGEGFVPMIDIVSREVDEGRLTSRIMPPEESLTIAAATDQVLDALAGLKEGGR